MPLKPHPTDPDKVIFVSHRYDLQSHANEYERGFIDGMQKQMQSSVDKAVNAMGKREWVGLTKEEINQGLLRSFYVLEKARAWRDGVAWAEEILKRKNYE